MGDGGRVRDQAIAADTAEGPAMAEGVSEQLVEAGVGAAPASDGRGEYMAALTIRTRSLERAGDALAAGQIGGVKRESNRILVPATETFGVTLEFRS